ncbi:archaeosortase A [Natronomonas marina]|jgi:archaeosortase A (PGF-CTERM-specific)|uniref:archaeosortase A n=1 Tax=Natronomonas marina TaxID=2961939 RepID=UPI0020C99728|nr:archaeosortase A [Natronomonas marina]
MSVPVQSLTEVSVLPVTDALAWVVIAVFLAGVAADYADRRALARKLTVAAWGLFSVFWLLLIHQFAFIHRSIIQTVLVVIAVPMCLYVGWTLLGGRDSLLVLSRAVAVMGLIYLPFQTSAAARGFLIETVARQTTWLLEVVGLGGGMRLVEDPHAGSSLHNTFFFPESGRASRVVFACTGIGSMAIFGGLIGAVRAPLRRKVVALAVSLSIIWVLNVGRNAFIAAANGYQWFDYAALEGPVMTAFGLSDPARVSFFLADRVISQGLALFALVGIAWLVSRWVPELLGIAEDLLYLLTGDEVRLRPPSAATDGGDPER